MTRHVLTGAPPEPLASYLIGLAVLRLLAQQGHPDTQAFWSERGLVLESGLDREALLDFFLDDYTPTPMVSPWNKGAGFRGNGKSKTAEDLVNRVRSTTSSRFGPTREAMAVAVMLNAAYPDDGEYTKAKDLIVQEARSRMPDAALDWIDAAVTLTEDGPVYPHILGTGGNLGRLDLTANALEHLEKIIGFDQPCDRTRSRAWLEDALFATGAKWVRASAGQYEPGVVGGANQSSTGDGVALTNPWGFVLALEGTLVFASGIARRLGGAGNNVAAMPFTVRPDAAGAAHLSPSEKAKGELWLPLWEQPTQYAQIRLLFGEGRLRWRGRVATRGIDAARSVATLGTQRGVRAFSRVAIVERLGQSPLAIPAGRFRVESSATAALTAQLDPWLTRVRRQGNAPAAVGTRLRAIDGLLLRVSADVTPTASSEVRKLLSALFETEALVWKSGKLRGELNPLRLLKRDDWLHHLDDGTPEFRLATALTSADDRKPFRERAAAPGRWRPLIIEYLRPIDLSRPHPRWHAGPRLSVNLRHDPIGTLASVHATHATRLRPEYADNDKAHAMSESWPWFESMDTVSHEDVEAMLGEQFRPALFAEHLMATSLLTPRGNSDRPSRHERVASPPNPAWRLLATTTHAWQSLETPEDGEPKGTGPRPDAGWVSALRRGSVETVQAQALRQLHRFPDRKPPSQDPRRASRRIDGPAVAAALLFQLEPLSVRDLREWCCPRDEANRATAIETSEDD